EAHVADQERPIAIAPISEAEAKSDNGQRKIAEEQFEPFPGRRVEAELEIAKRHRVRRLPVEFRVPVERHERDRDVSDEDENEDDGPHTDRRDRTDALDSQ